MANWNTEYNLPLKIIRPSFTPLNLSTLIAWWDAADQSNITVVTGVSSWVDRSGNETLTQATTTKQPVNNTSNGSVDFDGVDDFMLTSGGWSGGALSQPGYIILGFEDEDDRAAEYAFYDVSSGSNRWQARFAFSPFNKCGIGSDSLVGGVDVIPQGQDIVHSAVFNSPSSNSWIDGSPDITSATTGTRTCTGLLLAAINGGTAHFGKLKIKDIIVGEGTLTAADHNSIGTYLTGKYGTSWTTVS